MFATLIAQIPPAIAQQVPGWFWIILVGLIAGAIPVFSGIVVYFLKRELARFDSVLAAIPSIDRRVTILEASVDVKRELREGVDRLIDAMQRRS